MYLLIRRPGTQESPISNGRENCNEFSIGIELEGTDELEYTQEQYDTLVEVSRELMVSYPLITKGNIVGHCDIAQTGSR